MFGYRRTRYASRFTPPQLGTFAVSVVLALLAILATYGGTTIPFVSGNAFLTLLIAWIVLVAGVLMPGL
jgi:hypothetical protein